MEMLSKIVILCMVTLCSGDGIPLASDCGKREFHPDWRIIGGTDAAVGEFPWQIQLTPATNTDPNIQNFCGGTVLNERWILTAAHCIVNMTIKVRLGIHNESIHEKTEIVSPIEKIFQHENWTINDSEILNDIALIKLTKTIDLSKNRKYVAPICLARKNTKLTKKCITTGWGNTSQKTFQRPLNGILKKVDLPLIDNSQCQNASSHLDHFSYDESTQLCAGGTSGHSTCNMDSGGPLQCLGEDGLWYQVGVTSYGFTRICGLQYSPDVFTKVSVYIDWIQNILTKN